MLRPDYGLSNGNYARAASERLRQRGDEADKAGDPATAGLMLFYSAECGLKAEILDRVLKARDTSTLPAELRTHNLRVLAKELRLPAVVQDAVKSCTRKSRTDQPRVLVAPKELHEAWRYGADLDPEEQNEALAALRNLIEAARTCP
ncbi:hypothetical protein GCM10009654_58920 [Streptomyces hebeiensis]|uniref:HEPN domain-containing protein n=1 Tax=Streptomyces hebeiensis TaxID=229486 RepID=A0ABN1V546_9ACTN